MGKPLITGTTRKVAIMSQYTETRETGKVADV